MSYAGIATLARDAIFQDRVSACATIECQARLDLPDQPDESNLAYDTLRGATHVMDAFIRIVAQTPAIIDTAGDPPDQAALTDENIKVAVVDAFPVVTKMWYNADGTPWGGAYLPTPTSGLTAAVPDTVPEGL